MTSRSVSQQFYPLECDRLGKNCEVVAQFNTAYDSRYTNLGLSISEYDVQKESKVLSKLQDMPNYSMYTSDSNKRSVKYGFWGRSTIS